MSTFETYCCPASTALNSRSIVTLADSGIDISSETATALIFYLQSFLRENRDVLPRCQVQEQLGYREATIVVEGQPVTASVYQLGRDLVVPTAFAEYREVIENALRIEPRGDGEASYIRAIAPAGSRRDSI